MKVSNLKDILSIEMTDSALKPKTSEEDTDIVEDEVKVEIVPESYFISGNI